KLISRTYPSSRAPPGERSQQMSASEPSILPEATSVSAEVDPERQRRAREYARIRHRLLLVDLGLAAVFLLVFLGTGLSSGLRDALAGTGEWQPVAGWAPLQVGLYFIILLLVYQVLDAPLSYYSGFVLPHRYQLSHQSLGSWLADLGKGLV